MVVIDMNLSPFWELFLQENQIDAAHWSRIGNAWASDEEIFEFAFQNNHIIFTNDLDFGTILSKTRGRLPSIIQVRSLDVSIENIGEILVKCIRQNEDILREGALVTIETDRLRIRTLPIH